MALGVGSWVKENVVDTGEVAKDVVGGVIEFVVDPFGTGEAAADAASIAEESATSGIKALQEQQQTVEELYEDYYNQAITSALPQLQAMTMGGDIDYKPSKLYEYQKELGTRNIRRVQAAKGQLGSSGTKSKLASFYGDIAAEEAERAYGGTLSQIQIGSGAAGVISAAGGAIAGNVGSLYSNLGVQQANIAQQAGGARQALYQSYGNMMGGLASYMGGM